MEEVLRYGRMMFIYDTSCCTREEDDPAEAICFLRCGGGGVSEQLAGVSDVDGAAVVDSAALHLVCQLMGTAFFTEKDMAAFPSLIRLQHGQFVLHRDGNFIWVMHTSGEDETYVTRAQLTRTRQALRLLHGGLPEVLAAVGGERAALRRRLSRTLGPLLSAAGTQPPLERVLDVLPRLDWAQKDDFIAQQLWDVRNGVLRVPGVLACVLCWDAKVISNDDVDEFVEVLVHIHWLPKDAFDLVDVDFALPSGTMLARVHLGSELHGTLLRAAETRSRSSGSEKSAPPSTSPSELPPLDSIDESAEPAADGGVTSSTQDGGDGRGKENRPAGSRHRRRRRRSPDKPQTPAEGAAAGPAAAGAVDSMGSESPSATRHRISALALQALSAECARAEPPPPPALDQIPVRRLQRPRSSRRPRRSLSELEVPEPFSNLAYLRRRQPDLYRDELRKLQATLPDNQPAFTSVSANPYSFGIPRSNRLYTPRLAGAEPGAGGEPSLPFARGLPRRPAHGSPAGYASENPRLAGSPRGPAAGRRFFSDGEGAGWRPRQLAALLRDGGATRLPGKPPAAQRLATAYLYTHSVGKLRCHVLLKDQQENLRGLIQQLSHLSDAGLLELESMLRSYRSIPSFHGQHYSYVSVKDRSASGGGGSTGGGRQLDSDGVSHIDCHLIQMVHADLLAGRLADCRIRTPSDVLLAQRSGSTETYYQQRTSGHQTGLPAVNGPLCRVDDRARKRLGTNHGLTIG